MLYETCMKAGNWMPSDLLLRYGRPARKSLGWAITSSAAPTMILRSSTGEYYNPDHSSFEKQAKQPSKTTCHRFQDFSVDSQVKDF